ncbi:hypothetical protein K458DRAFT_415723 [Lentithecium fluviatile CBS 122367]|uniref:Uncharacterized protein n=1 Tax=Lentithecium fluviatile CBS 122367 TaxID=1168545 RepID=A0A6G1JBG4_9PLEO|nr:hypothetical protein K458DRAFT_415723 [Lentithecium fluviatile CBS 122367]
MIPQPTARNPSELGSSWLRVQRRMQLGSISGHHHHRKSNEGPNANDNVAVSPYDQASERS